MPEVFIISYIVKSWIKIKKCLLPSNMFINPVIYNIMHNYTDYHAPNTYK